MADTIKCTCGHCGAKYRLPVEAQGRTARCKKCGDKFAVPREESLEDSILNWLTEPDPEDESLGPPKVISMPAQAAGDSDLTKRARGPIRMKTEAGEPIK